VNIALIEAHAPVLGVVHVPVRDTSYQGLPGVGAWRESAAGPTCQIHVRTESADPLRVVGSRSHRGDSLDAFLGRIGPYELVPVGSSLKFCMVAEGAADVYPRLGPTSEWDTAAAHAVVLAAGGEVSTLDGSALRYNTRESLLNPFFVAYGPKDRDWLALLR
jgi:3'(2'), 5'-bisphosphate nucleotidase